MVSPYKTTKALDTSFTSPGYSGGYPLEEKYDNVINGNTNTIINLLGKILGTDWTIKI